MGQNKDFLLINEPTNRILLKNKLYRHPPFILQTITMYNVPQSQ